MKVLLVCAGGMSTSILMKKMEKYAADQGIADFEIAAVGVAAYKDIWQNYDCILLGPQVGVPQGRYRQGRGDPRGGHGSARLRSGQLPQHL